MLTDNASILFQRLCTDPEVIQSRLGMLLNEGPRVEDWFPFHLIYAFVVIFFYAIDDGYVSLQGHASNVAGIVVLYGDDPGP